MNKNSSKIKISSILLLFILIFLLLRMGDFTNGGDYTSLNDIAIQIKNGEFNKVEISGNKILAENTENGKKMYSTIADEFKKEFYDDNLKEKISSNEIEFYSSNPSENSLITSGISVVLMILASVVIFYFIFSKSSVSPNGMQNFSKNKAILNENKNLKIDFNSVAGLKEEKEELLDIVEFLKNPKKFSNLGARIPKGVLLVGPPGTGKTYISKAVAGEAKVPFYSISGSDFVEMFVGVGASRVRSMFDEAKKNAPCIVFIDEIDAVGRQRGTGLGGGHDEREQTLNQLLVEMDGFSDNEGVIVMAATNRPDILDKALLRPGRFDRQIYIGLPDIEERKEVFKVHTKNKPLSSDVDFDSLSKQTTGFTPAEIENVTNEAALIAAKKNEEIITPIDFEEATIKVIAGPEKKSKVVIQKERELTAVHESGHALTQSLIDGMDPVNLITIIPRGLTGGFTSFLPQEERSFMTKGEMINEIITLLAGRAAEYVMLDDISTGASNDIERATKIADDMVKIYGMSDNLGPVLYENDTSQPFLGRDIGHSKIHSEKTQLEIDMEVEKIIKTSYKKAIDMINDNKELLLTLKNKLLEKETIKAKEVKDIIEKYKKEREINGSIQ
ncbi:MAG: ATP-dependent zinc metalloprotease FtsH [Peptoniphilaceae bacterium]|nr:ATP-dependent zinc metalloprotease FtsH [Peptoniphilaceae bacterium]MDD7383344.1 ATP-dependent zinc metalloprotease FtsH [Peptoniphilaceae bacterium]MDY3738285.1 ATP-dependent zinc metalloprotease FtsH [Peptoniphilaceae bacterium]